MSKMVPCSNPSCKRASHRPGSDAHKICAGVIPPKRIADRKKRLESSPMGELQTTKEIKSQIERIYYEIYPEADHSAYTSNAAIIDMLRDVIVKDIVTERTRVTPSQRKEILRLGKKLFSIAPPYIEDSDEEKSLFHLFANRICTSYDTLSLVSRSLPDQKSYFYKTKEGSEIIKSVKSLFSKEDLVPFAMSAGRSSLGAFPYDLLRGHEDAADEIVDYILEQHNQEFYDFYSVNLKLGGAGMMNNLLANSVFQMTEWNTAQLERLKDVVEKSEKRYMDFIEWQNSEKKETHAANLESSVNHTISKILAHPNSTEIDQALSILDT